MIAWMTARNGRTARVLCTLILYQNGYDFKRLFSLSEYYDKNRREYYDAIQLVRESGLDMTAWLEYFVRGLKNQMLEVRTKGEEVIKKDIIIENDVSIRTANYDLEVMEVKILVSSFSIPPFHSICICCPDESKYLLEHP